MLIGAVIMFGFFMAFALDTSSIDTTTESAWCLVAVIAMVIIAVISFTHDRNAN